MAQNSVTPVVQVGKPYRYTWEEAIESLRQDPRHGDLIFDAYLTSDLLQNCRRFAASAEFAETLALVRTHQPRGHDLLDVPAGNGIGTVAFAKAGFNVTAVEPDSSESVGRGAIAKCLAAENLTARIVTAYGESLPFEPRSFDIVYVRQGLHHARDLKAMLREYARVLRPGGLLLCCREHVVDDYNRSLQAFLDNQVDHQLYGGEHAFTLTDYVSAFEDARLKIVRKYGPYDSSINLHPNTLESLAEKICSATAGRILGVLLPRPLVVRLGMWRLRRSKRPGRLYSFLAIPA